MAARKEYTRTDYSRDLSLIDEVKRTGVPLDRISPGTCIELLRGYGIGGAIGEGGVHLSLEQAGLGRLRGMVRGKYHTAVRRVASPEAEKYRLEDLSEPVTVAGPLESRAQEPTRTMRQGHLFQ